MMVVIAYDISSCDSAGRKRLYRISRKCADAGVCVQKSVYECELNAQQFLELKESLERILCPQTDSIRFYHLGNRYHSRIENLGRERNQWDRETFVL